ncbi:MAG TPA: sensor histidine kinase [Steroidobacteraceae bacterium]|nr:sensor histidine kinase [Steroidobacteraceae bacterium]
MSESERIRAESAARILADLTVVAAATLICGILAVRFQWSEWLFAWTRREESLDLDEFTFVLLTLAVGLAWLSARRWRGTRRELRARLMIQGQLAQTLDEQRRLARQFVELQERERKRISQELHDELGQFVNAIKLDAVAIRTISSDPDTGQRTAIRDRARSIVISADLVHESIARLVRELRPVGLDELGLSAAIEHCADVWRPRLEPVRLSLSIDEHVDSLDEARTLALYRTVQEALTNCARHARSATRIDIRLDWSDGDGVQPGVTSVRVEDDGVGTDLNMAPSGLGLAGMRERLTALGGSLCIDSAPHAGFRLHARVPAAQGVKA